MKLRCDIHLNSQNLKLVLVPNSSEKLEHLALKLAAAVMFSPRVLSVEPSSDHPALYDVDIRPDLMGTNEAGEVDLWVECGSITKHKLDKIIRRFRRTRIVVLKPSLREANRLREVLSDEIRHADRVEIWTWPEGEFSRWVNALEEKVEIFGESWEKGFNLVVNEEPYAVDMISV